ncbi:MAG: MmcQ/YjbR family DNA-binding protein [Propionibacteriaceae bacterium]
MPHPQMYDEDDPVYRRVRELALGFPGAAEKYGHGRPMFYTVKVFAYYGGSIKVDGAYVRHEQAILFVPDAVDREGLLADPRVFRPAYLGPFGWLGIDLDLGMDWTEAQEILDASYRLTAPRRLVSELDARASPP